LSSARSARQIRARPMPNFERLHEKWGILMENRKQNAYKPTVVGSSHLTNIFKRLFPLYVILVHRKNFVVFYGKHNIPTTTCIVELDQFKVTG